jgi:hypothetical protein
MTVLQGLNFVLWMLQAMRPFMPIGLQFAVMVYVGLLGGVLLASSSQHAHCSLFCSRAGGMCKLARAALLLSCSPCSVNLRLLAADVNTFYFLVKDSKVPPKVSVSIQSSSSHHLAAGCQPRLLPRMRRTKSSRSTSSRCGVSSCSSSANLHACSSPSVRACSQRGHHNGRGV